MERRRCAACGRLFRPRPQVPRQRYCEASACQRERRRRWQREKRSRDPDYRDNQRRAQRHWLERHPEYWRRYRRTHPDYTRRNRAQQRARDRRRRGAGAAHASAPLLAKMDASRPISPPPRGTYRLIPLGPAEGLAKRDAWMVEIAWLSKGYDSIGGACKETT